MECDTSVTLCQRYLGLKLVDEFLQVGSPIFLLLQRLHQTFVLSPVEEGRVCVCVRVCAFACVCAPAFASHCDFEPSVLSQTSTTVRVITVMIRHQSAQARTYTAPLAGAVVHSPARKLPLALSRAISLSHTHTDRHTTFFASSNWSRQPAPQQTAAWARLGVSTRQRTVHSRC